MFQAEHFQLSDWSADQVGREEPSSYREVGIEERDDQMTKETEMKKCKECVDEQMLDRHVQKSPFEIYLEKGNGTLDISNTQVFEYFYKSTIIFTFKCHRCGAIRQEVIRT